MQTALSNALVCILTREGSFFKEIIMNYVKKTLGKALLPNAYT